MKCIQITFFYRVIVFLIITLLFHSACSNNSADSQTDDSNERNHLKHTFKNDFLIGAAINDDQFNGIDTQAIDIILKEYNTITSENIMKSMYLHPAKDTFFFEVSDKYVEFGERHDMHIIGHTLVWHSQLGEWMNQLKDSSEMASALSNHIHTIVDHYKGRIDSWDVVNEALNEDGSLRESVFYNAMGGSYLVHAFKMAEAADPQVELVYNDYNLWKPEKREGVIRLIKELRANGARIDGVGMQAHWSLLGPTIEDIENSILAYAEHDVRVMFTELDVTTLPNPWDLEGAEVSQNFEGSPFMNPYPNGLPDSMQVKVAERYEDIFSLFLKHQDKISRVTFWGVNDGQSWLNGWPIKGRTNYPLLFDREFKPKLAYDRVNNIKKAP